MDRNYSRFIFYVWPVFISLVGGCWRCGPLGAWEFLEMTNWKMQLEDAICLYIIYSDRFGRKMCKIAHFWVGKCAKLYVFWSENV